MQDLRITLVQTTLFWENIPENLGHFEKKLTGLSGKQDLILLPEMFNSGFTVKPERVAETPGSATMRWMQKMASTHGCIIAGTMIVKDGGYFFNRLICMNPDGSYQSYDKRHLFRMGNEHLRFSAGRKKLVINVNGWKICLLTCYDLRFPVWSKNTYTSGTFAYDVLIYLANWPARRNKVWKALLPARAMENLSYVIGLNRVGKDGNDMDHTGDSMLIGPKGNVLSRIKANADEIRTLVMKYDSLERTRQNFNVALDWDNFRIDL